MKVAIGILFVLLTSCTRENHGERAKVINVTEIAQEQNIPKQLLQELDNELKDDFKSLAPLYSFLPVTVQFEELQPGVLTSPKIQYVFPKGGGSVDLKDIVASEGSFYMSFPEEQFDKESDLLHIFYVSNSPRIQVEKEHFGMGCGKWSDLKKSFSKLKKPDYLKLNTNNLRHLRVLAGTYIFIFRQTRNIYLTQLTVTDTNHLGDLCSGVSANG